MQSLGRLTLQARLLFTGNNDATHDNSPASIPSSPSSSTSEALTLSTNTQIATDCILLSSTTNQLLQASGETSPQSTCESSSSETTAFPSSVGQMSSAGINTDINCIVARLSIAAGPSPVMQPALPPSPQSGLEYLMDGISTDLSGIIGAGVAKHPQQKRIHRKITTVAKLENAPDFYLSLITSKVDYFFNLRKMSPITGLEDDTYQARRGLFFPFGSLSRILVMAHYSSEKVNPHFAVVVLFYKTRPLFIYDPALVEFHDAFVERMVDGKGAITIDCVEDDFENVIQTLEKVPSLSVKQSQADNFNNLFSKKKDGAEEAENGGISLHHDDEGGDKRLTDAEREAGGNWLPTSKFTWTLTWVFTSKK